MYLLITASSNSTAQIQHKTITTEPNIIEDIADLNLLLFKGAKKDAKSTSKAPAKTPKKKEGGGGGKAKKKKWSKGKTRDKLNNLVLFDKATYDKLLKEVPTYKLITPSIVSERLKVRGSLARKALAELLQKGKYCSLIKS